MASPMEPPAPTTGGGRPGRDPLRRLEGVVRTQHEVNQHEADLPGLMHLVAERTQELTGAAGAVIEILEGDEMVYRAATGTIAPHLGLRLKAATSLSGLCVREGRALRCDDSETDPRVDREACRRVGVRSMIVVPLPHASGVAGVLKVMSPHPGGFDGSDLQTLELMAGLIGAAMARAAARDALHASEQRFRKLFEDNPLGMAMVAPDFAFLNVNDSLCRMLGYAKEELMRLTWPEITYPEDLPRETALMEHLFRGEITSFQLEKRYVAKDGQLVWAQLTRSLVRDPKGNILYALATIEDLRERKRAEAERQRIEQERHELERLREMSLFQTRLINAAAHELNTPLTPVRVQLHLLRTRNPDALTAEQRRSLDVLDRNLQRLSRLARDVLEVSRVDAAQLTVNRKPVALRPILEEAADTFRAAAEAAKVTLHLEAPAEATVAADGPRVAQVLAHLLDNALKVMPRGGTLHLGAVREGDHLRVEVRDSGIGLTPQQIAALEHPFAHVHDGPDAPPAGPGLGLFLSRGIVEAHGGRLRVESPGPGKGTTVSFTLPLA
ncbi:MAG TPA: PAS domain S-box protein [Candidatus Thermoplasmatota archaeon]|nr:PAS domain S-box protein [Candidatus Thermoplasmatota archaeon]